MTAAAHLAVHIVTWNSASQVADCIRSLAAQGDRRFEVVVVDNASADGSAECVERWGSGLPSLTVVRQTRNLGFCGGQNEAMSRSTAPWVLFLNPDTALPASFVADAIRIAGDAEPRIGSIAPKLLRPDGRIDSTGLEMDRFRRAYDRNRGGPPGLAPAVRGPVFGCTGAAALHRRLMLEDVSLPEGPLDELLFAYYDDLDLAWRASLRGWTCVYEPTLRVSHQRAARNAVRGVEGRPPRRRDQMLSVRNRLLTMMKCERPADLLAALPWLLPFEAARIAYLTARSPRLLAAYAAVWRDARSALARRRFVHRTASPVASPIHRLPWRVR